MATHRSGECVLSGEDTVSTVHPRSKLHRAVCEGRRRVCRGWGESPSSGSYGTVLGCTSTGWTDYRVRVSSRKSAAVVFRYLVRRRHSIADGNSSCSLLRLEGWNGGSGGENG